MIADSSSLDGFMGSWRWVCVKTRLLGSQFSHAVPLQSGNAQAQRRLQFSLHGVGDVLLSRGDLAGAQNAYEEALAIAATPDTSEVWMDGRPQCAN
jgi:hypothetical protein